MHIVDRLFQAELLASHGCVELQRCSLDRQHYPSRLRVGVFLVIRYIMYRPRILDDGEVFHADWQGVPGESAGRGGGEGSKREGSRLGLRQWETVVVDDSMRSTYCFPPKSHVYGLDDGSTVSRLVHSWE